MPKAYDVAPKRKQKGITQRNLAERLNWSEGTLVDVELGRVDITSEQQVAIHKVIEQLAQERKEVVPV